MTRRYDRHCDDCNQSFDRVSFAPMLFDATWLRLAQKHECLCDECLFRRASERKVVLTLADLRPCPFNRFGEPLSWFDLFASGERHEVIKTWLAWYDEAEQREAAR